MQFSRFWLEFRLQQADFYFHCDQVSLGADFYLFYSFALAIISESGGKRTRTADILLAKQALYQLSYTPTKQVLILIGMSP